ncbi:hypothetical protein IMW82_03475 [Rhodanobacter sp. B2A1Ga4]|uniref:hypothetical protein n=1 Tax=Rhodanobacter sp. B2A1Ga4 TaxID=2778647 RepID=UPI001B378097|nr:hypothetical protein [Rhodanobacter sp. B2A1Ga4]MBQ4853740.1 hypothetical protein [Rhodanobacter sp. B2A1Ga4]
MKTKGIIVVAVLAVAMCAPSFAGSHAKSSGYSAPSSTPVHVSGHVTKNGTYVAPSYRTAPNATKTDNWSSKPNVNPYTGKAGTKDPYAAPANGH